MEKIWKILEEVSDPEIPVLSVIDLGIIRDVRTSEDGTPIITITPTYSGCPAMNTIEVNIRAVLQDQGYETVKVETVLHPAWTTDWMTEAGRKKLLAYGIAPPVKGSVDKQALFAEHPVVACPQCGSENTQMLSQFGSTACKSLYQCRDCMEPFDYFKCH
jgi:ring-1,2-phenylacetyl-CoA epoxidase subunit PaaD